MTDPEPPRSDEAASHTEPSSAGGAGAFVVGAVVADTYELRSLLGTGGMGQVFDAWDRALQRRVAIKALWSDIDPVALVAEARALAAIKHPGVPAVYALWEHARVPFVVMEQVRGTSLYEQHRQRQKEHRPYTIAEVLHLLIGIADGLHAAHSAGVAHRDVKPENVLITPGGRIMLIDFGLMLPQASIAGATGSISGTPEYMAPESISDDVERGAAHLVDVYALGVVAYELLTDRVPYPHDDAKQALRAHLRAPVPDVAAARPDVPERLARLVTSMLAKLPRERPGGMEDVLAELRSLETAGAPEARARATPKAESSAMSLEDQLEKALEEAAKLGRTVALLRVALCETAALAGADPDRSALLDLVGQRIGGCSRQHDVVVRLAEGRFGLILTNVRHPEDAAIAAGRIVRAMEKPLAAGGSELRLGASVGIALFPTDATDADALCACAERAVRAAQAAGRGRYQWATAQDASPASVARDIVWSEVHVVGIAAIDAQHHGLVERTNRLVEGMRSGLPLAKLLAALQELVDATDEHFAYEERLMAEHRVDSASGHIALHRRLLDDLRSLAAGLDERSLLLTMRYLHEWLFGHVDKTDLVLAKALRARGVS
jgi:serine/threonine-protein kinase